MSIKAMQWAFMQRLAGNDKVVLLALADEANDEGEQCYPSHKRIADKCCISDRSVRTIIKRLSELGLVTVLSSGGGRTSNNYKLNIEGQETTFDTPENISGAEAGFRAPRKQLLPRTPEAATSDDPLYTRDKPITNSALEDEFEIWWRDLVPERDGGNPKKEAKTKYIKFRKSGVSKEVIWRSTNEWRDELARLETPPRFIKQAFRWLNTEPWVK